MMLSLLLDENIPNEVARQISAKRAEIAIFAALDWEESRLRGKSDDEVLRAAAAAGLTLVTYDVNTIPLLLVQLASEAFVHIGIVFVNNAAIRSNDYGGLVRALIQLYDAEVEANWQGRLYFLPPVR
jgi:predicted nuclease of predicted toxin-antitoxin system